MAKTDLSAERLREIFNYDPDTGEFTRLVKSGNAPVGTKPACVASTGYIVFRVDGRLYAAHRLAWLYVKGEFPVGVIDHIDGNKVNNTFSNLRDVPPIVNGQNTGMRKNNTTGVQGVSFDKITRNWCARITVNFKGKNLGRFDTLTEAKEAYQAAKASLHPESVRHAV